MARYSTEQLNRLFLDSLGEAVVSASTITDKPLLVETNLDYFNAKLRVYLFNCTNPPGGRKSDEYKCQITLPGLRRGEHCSFIKGDGRIALLGAVAKLAETNDAIVFIFWDAMYHENCSYSANIQVKSEILISAFAKNVSVGIKSNNEKIVACRPMHLREGIKERIFTV